MTSSLQENVKMYLIPSHNKILLIYFGNLPKNGFGFRVNYILKNPTLKNLKILLLCNGLSNTVQKK